VKRRYWVLLVVISTLAGTSSIGPASASAESCPNRVAREQTGSQSLPDCRAYELVSPVEKSGNEAGAEISSSSGGVPQPNYSVARADGEALLFGSAHEVINGALGETEAGINYFWVSRRSPSGWSTRAALPPGNRERENNKENGVQLDLPTPILPSASLREFAIETQDSLGAAPSATNEGGYIVHADGTVSWISQPAVENPEPPLNETVGGAAVRIAGASPDLHTVYFGYSGTLVPEDYVKDAAVEDLARSEVIAGGSHPDVGLYEWHEGVLKSAGVLPDRSVDPYGAVPVATQAHNGFENVPNDYANNQVSADGRRAVFISPDPQAGAPASDPPELYVREQTGGGEARSVLVSKSAITGLPAASAPLRIREPHPETANNGETYAYASPNGARVIFEDVEQLTAKAPNDGSAKDYEFNTETEVLTYLPGVAGSAGGAPELNESPVLASSQDGSSFLFEKHTPSGSELDLWNGHVTTVSRLPPPTAGRLVIAPVRATADGSVYTFETNSSLPGASPNQYNNAGPYEQIYRYEVATGDLGCVSCPPSGVTPTGSAHMSNSNGQTQVLDSRGTSRDANRIFFDTPDALVPQDVNGKRDVYEWQGGSIREISSGTGSSDSFLLDNDELGENVFFATADSLVSQDTDGGYDVYDARAGGGFVPAAPPPGCQAACQEATGTPPVFGTPGSATFAGVGNLTLGTAKPPAARKTASQLRAERLKKALKACGSRPRHSRGACERQARHRYGAKAANKTKQRAR